MLLGALWMWWAGLAQAGRLPAGARTVYVGSGVTTFATGSSGLDRDRQVRARWQGYGAYGLSDSVDLALSLPLVGVWVVEDPKEGPCPTATDYCQPTMGVGTAEARAQVSASFVDFALGLTGDPWNAQTRSRWTNIGQGVVAGFGAITTNLKKGPWLARPWIRYDWVFGRPVGTDRFPADLVSGGVAVARPVGVVTLEGGVQTQHRLGGVPFGDEWVENYFPLEDRWGALRYRDVAAGLKAWGPMGQGWTWVGSLGGTVWADAGPRDQLDVGFGVARYWE